MSVRFCPRCDMLLRVERRDYDLILFCPNCGFRRVVKWDDTIIVQDGVEDDFEDRIRVLGGCFAALGFDVFRRFDMNEPEFKALEVISKLRMRVLSIVLGLVVVLMIINWVLVVLIGIGVNL